MSDTPATRWWARRAAWPVGVLLLGAVVTAAGAVTLWTAAYQPPDWGFWEYSLSLFLISAPWGLCAFGLWLASGTPMFSWAKGQARIELALGILLLLTTLGAVIWIPNVGFGRSLSLAFVMQPVLLVVAFLGLRSVVFTLRWQWGARPDGWHDSEDSAETR